MIGQDLLNFKRWNRIVGWSVFAIAALTYLLTIEPSSSFWDCGEFIATSYKLEVGHPPGAPLFMLLARIATMLAPSPEYVPHMVNGMNALASAFCILFMFWTVTHIARRLITRNGGALNRANTIAALGAGAVGALAYTFTDTFWFSAVEGEVYAMSSMFTALVVWLMLRWEEEADEPHSARWIILIAYLMGLSIGVHILNLLTIPALVFIYYFRKYNKITLWGMAIATLVAGALLFLVNGVIIPYTVYVGAKIDIFFVNSLSLPVNSGMIFFALLVFVLLGAAILVTHTLKLRILNLLALCVTMIMLGFSSYAAITIRASVNPPMNSNNPDNPSALLSMLNRDQYGNRPLIYGPSYAAPVEYEEDGTPKCEYKEVDYYNPKTGKYETHNEIDDYVYVDKFMHFFPRMWNSMKGEEAYKKWVTIPEGKEYGQKVTNRSKWVDENGKTRYDEETIVEPKFQENMEFFFSYQLIHMYWRYFMWNFVGRQDDIQAEGNSQINGNWISGWGDVADSVLGREDNLPSEMANNKARNTYFFLPFLLGLLGLVYQLYRDPRNFTVVMWLFIMMGIALVFYFNTSPDEARERDYVYAGSFYAFSMWIGLGVLALYHIFSWVWGKCRTSAAIIAVVVSMVVPGILCAQNWDDHDRSHRTIARDVGYNYLSSIVEKEGVSPIIVNYGDNDTFPLWFNQEVDGVRTDVRIMNSSYLDGAWYVDEMKCKANDADGIPFSLPREKYTNTNDFIYVYPQKDYDNALAKEVFEFIRSNKKETKLDTYAGLSDYVPTQTILLPVDKEAAISSGIVAEKDRDLMLDNVKITIKSGSLTRSELMILDMLAHFDWKRPIYFTQVYVLQKFGLLDYLQFDGYAYRFVPIYTEYEDSWSIGRIDAAYAYDKLMYEFRYGNLADPRVYVDEFTQYNIKVSRAREAFARVAKEYLKIADDEKLLQKENISREECYVRAEKLLDRGLEVLPITQIRFTDANTVPFVECYYDLAKNLGKSGKKEDLEASDRVKAKGDALLTAYSNNLMEYVTYYAQFGKELIRSLGAKISEMSYAFRLAGEGKLDPLANRLEKMYNKINIKTSDSDNNIIYGYYHLDRTEESHNLLETKFISLKDVLDKNMSSDEKLSDFAINKLGELWDLTKVAVECNNENIASASLAYFYQNGYNSDPDELLADYVGKLVTNIEEEIAKEENEQRDSTIYANMDKLNVLYSLAYDYNREEIVRYINQYYRSLGAEDKDLLLTQQEKDELGIK